MKTSQLTAFALAIAFGTSFQAACANEIKPLNSVAMEVNSSIITYGDIARAARQLKADPANKGIPEAELLKAARQQLIERTILADAARQQGLKTTDSGIDEELARRAAAQHTTVAKLYTEAAAAGYSREAFRLEIAKDVLINYMTATLTGDIKISDAQIDEAMRTHTGRLPAGEPYTVYTVRRIILNAGNQSNMAAVEKRLQQIATAIAQGGDFAAFAKRYSQEPEAANGGLHDDITDYMLPENVENVLHKMQPNQTSAPLRSGTSWQILQLVSTRVENNPAKMQREAVRRALVRQVQKANQQQFIAQLQQTAVLREY